MSYTQDEILFGIAVVTIILNVVWVLFFWKSEK